MKKISFSSKSIMGECYISNDTQHKKNEHHGPNLLWRWWLMGNQILCGCTCVQFVTIFDLLKCGRLMINLKKMKDMFNFLRVANTPRKHLIDFSGWANDNHHA